MRVRAVLSGVCLVAAIALLTLLLLIQPESGVSDVHLPEAAQPLLATIRLPVGEPYIVGPGLGRIPEFAAIAEKLAALAAGILLIWAIVKRRKSVAKTCALLLCANALLGPIPMRMQPTPPIAVSAEVGRALVRAMPTAGRASPEQRYVRSQVAYLNGDHALSAKFAAGLDGDQLASPIEAPFRLQYLRGEPIEVTSACFKLGCASPATRNVALLISATLFAGSTAAAILAFVAVATLRRRLARLETLSVKDRRRRLAA